MDTGLSKKEREITLGADTGVLYSEDGLRLLRVYDNCQHFVVKAGVKVICDEAFKGLTQLKTVDFPDSLELIGQSAFEGCMQLDEVNSLDKVDIIYGSAFRGTGLNKLDTSKWCGKKKLVIMENAFADCKSLKEVVLGKDTRILGSKVFSGCSSLVSVRFENNSIIPDRHAKDPLHIPHSATMFDGCESLQTISLPEGSDVDFGMYSGKMKEE